MPPVKIKFTTAMCSLCGKEFLPSRRYTKYCPGCGYAIDTKNYQDLTEEEYRIYLIYHRLAAKKWKKRHPRIQYLRKAKTVMRHNEETLMLASNHRSKWLPDEVEYLRKVGKIKTAREIAVDLGRTYIAVLVRACIEKIPLMTEDKMHGKLVTKLN